ARDLTPADIAQLDARLVLGIALAEGGPTSHSAILARTLGIPAVVGLGDSLLQVTDDTPLLLDGDTGRIWPNPSAKRQTEFARQAVARQARQAQALAASGEAAVTRDGHPILVAANIGTVADARQAVALGAEA